MKIDHGCIASSSTSKGRTSLWSAMRTSAEPAKPELRLGGILLAGGVKGAEDLVDAIGAPPLSGRSAATFFDMNGGLCSYQWAVVLEPNEESELLLDAPAAPPTRFDGDTEDDEGFPDATAAVPMPSTCRVSCTASPPRLRHTYRTKWASPIQHPHCQSASQETLKTLWTSWSSFPPSSLMRQPRRHRTAPK